MSSWYDPYALTATENFAALAARKRSPIRLVMGPWTHGQRSVTHSGGVEFGPESTLDRQVAPDYVTLRGDFFRRHLRGDDAPDWLAAPATVFVMGGGSGARSTDGRLCHGGRWLRTTHWPPPEAQLTRWHLHDPGLLSPQPCTNAARIDWRFDPRDPVPTIGGALASGAPLMDAGAFDQREHAELFGATKPGRALAERPDVRVFDSGPLQLDVEVVGPVVARLWVSTDARDTDFTIKLVDVYPASRDWPQGFAMNLTHGILRLRFRDGFERARLAEPRRVYPIQIVAFPTANRFMAGHRLRLEVSSSNFPHFDVNPNTGAPAGTSNEPVVAHNCVHVGPDCPSHVALHVMPAAKP
jgi:hypothetical protein